MSRVVVAATTGMAFMADILGGTEMGQKDGIWYCDACGEVIRPQEVHMVGNRVGCDECWESLLQTEPSAQPAVTSPGAETEPEVEAPKEVGLAAIASLVLGLLCMMGIEFVTLFLALLAVALGGFSLVWNRHRLGLERSGIAAAGLLLGVLGIGRFIAWALK